MSLPTKNKTLLIKNIGQLLQTQTGKKSLKGSEMMQLPFIPNAYLFIENGIIKDFGSMDNCPEYNIETFDAQQKILMPAWTDSHTHLVYAASRSEEFVDKIKGLTYEDIAKRGGGILNSAEKMAQISPDELYEKSAKLLQEAMTYGTGAIEIKSGYGLNLAAELKMLRVIKKLKEHFPIPVKATFLGAHAVPKKYINNKKAYIEYLINEMLPAVAQENLADYIDVFCEKNYFTAKETDLILKAGSKLGLKPKVHVNQFNSIGGVKIATQNNAISVDHLEIITDEDLKYLAKSETIATILPACSFFIDIPYAPAKKIMSYNIPLAIATDFNPGSTPTFNMNFAVSLACIKQKLTPEEAINAATINAAAALELSHEMGSISKGKKARLLLLKSYIKTYKEIPYFFAINPVEKTYFF